MRPRHNGCLFADDIVKRIFFNENVWISITISLNFVPKVRINIIPALVQIMAWRRPGDKPLSETMMVSLLTHICVTRPQWVKLVILSWIDNTLVIDCLLVNFKKSLIVISLLDIMFQTTGTSLHIWISLPAIVNTLRPRQNGSHFADDFFPCIFFSENCCIVIKLSLKYARKGPIDNDPALVQIMAWRRSGDKPLYEAMMINLPMHICATRAQWVDKSARGTWTLKRLSVGN